MRRVVITISKIYLDQLHTFAGELEEDGMIITHLYEFGVIIGVVSEEDISKIKDHKEIISLTDEKQEYISPPDSEIQSTPGE